MHNNHMNHHHGRRFARGEDQRRDEHGHGHDGHDTMARTGTTGEAGMAGAAGRPTRRTTNFAVSSRMATCAW